MSVRHSTVYAYRTEPAFLTRRTDLYGESDTNQSTIAKNNCGEKRQSVLFGFWPKIANHRKKVTERNRAKTLNALVDITNAVSNPGVFDEIAFTPGKAMAAHKTQAITRLTGV